jgi:hypothetical protein
VARGKSAISASTDGGLLETGQEDAHRHRQLRHLDAMPRDALLDQHADRRRLPGNFGERGSEIVQQRQRLGVSWLGQPVRSTAAGL